MTQARGRPPSGEFSGKTSVFTTRIRPELRAKLEAAARADGRSLSQEVERRLTDSFIQERRMEDTFGSQDNYWLMRVISIAIQDTRIPFRKMSEWRQDPLLFDVVVKTVNGMLESLRPGPPPSVALAAGLRASRPHCTACSSALAAADAVSRPAVGGGIVREYLDGYELRGDGGDHTPTDFERLLLEDFGLGLVGALAEKQGLLPRPGETDVVRELVKVTTELVEAACEVHPTAPSSASMKRLHGAIDASCKALASAEAFLAGREEAGPLTDQWRPIETAKKSGSDHWILLAVFDLETRRLKRAIAGYWNEHWEHWTDGFDLILIGPTHWMPLPAAPPPPAQGGQ